jgi:hypothetical protein
MTLDIDIHLDELKLHHQNMKTSIADPIKFRHYTSAFFGTVRRINAYHDLSKIAKREGLKGAALKKREQELRQKYGWEILGRKNEITDFVYRHRNTYEHEQALKLAIAAKVSVPKLNLNFEIEVKTENFHGEWQAPIKAKLVRKGITHDIPDNWWNYEYRFFFREWMGTQTLSMNSNMPDILHVCQEYLHCAEEYSSKLKAKLLEDGLLRADN